uniref:Uncharacterized protein n=1 Tax=Ditylenchus dipsaci TaxID=166011 RepID=A0A915E417_9BILA
MWRKDIIFAVCFIMILLLLLCILALCACRKSVKRKENFIKRKQFVRDSLRKSKQRQFEDSINNEKQHFSNGNATIQPTFAAMNPHQLSYSNGHMGGPPPQVPSESRSTSSMTTSGTTSTDNQTTSNTSYACCATMTACAQTNMLLQLVIERVLTPKVSLITGCKCHQVVDPPKPLCPLNPNPVNCPPSLAIPQAPVVLHDSSFCSASSRPGDCSSRTCTTCSCSTCPADSSIISTDQPSSVTEESLDCSSRSSQVSSSDSSTVTAGSGSHRPLLAATRAPSTSTLCCPNLQHSSMSTLQASSRPDLSSRRSDYFQGQAVMSPSRSNPSIYKPIPTEVPRVPPLKISGNYYKDKKSSLSPPLLGAGDTWVNRTRTKSGDAPAVPSSRSIYEN